MKVFLSMHIKKKDISFLFSNDTLWNNLEEPEILNANEFEELFAKTVTQPKKKALSEAYEKKAKARKVTHQLFNTFSVCAVCDLAARGR